MLGKDPPKSRKICFIGSLGSQRYEAKTNVKKFLKMIVETPASNETIRWKESKSSNPNLLDAKKGSRDQMRNNQIENSNAIIASRLYFVMNENRMDGTKEYAPGWRVGLKGGCTVIDCYASKRNDAMKLYQKHTKTLDHARQERNKVYFNAMIIQWNKCPLIIISRIATS